MRNYPATVHGAFLSGLREAGRLADLLMPQPPITNASVAAATAAANNSWLEQKRLARKSN